MVPLVLADDRRHILEHAAPDLWEPLRDQTIFVTGGTGFVGSWMMEAFAAANAAFDLHARAVLVTRDAKRAIARAPHLFSNSCFDLNEGDASAFNVPSDCYTFIIHAATERWFQPDAERPLGVLDADFAATKRVLDLAAKSGTRRLLFTSSGAAYGPAASNIDHVPETSHCAPETTDARAAYGESKRLSEFACASYARIHGFDAVIARLFAFVGPYLPLDEGYAVCNFLADALNGRPIRIAGDGTARRSYLYGADLALWLWTMLLRGASGRIYNVGSAESISIRELAEAVVATVARGSAISIGSSPVPGAAPSHYVPDTTGAESDLGLQVTVALPEALTRTFSYHSNQRITAPL